MDISLKVLNRYVKVDDQDPKELADKITSIGLEVEGMHDLTRGNNMTIGYVKECMPHPDSVHNSRYRSADNTFSFPEQPDD